MKRLTLTKPYLHNDDTVKENIQALAQIYGKVLQQY